jgi:phenylacetate-CoA ligase
MDVRLLTEVLLMRAALRRRDEWSAERLAQHQQQALAALRRHA